MSLNWNISTTNHYRKLIEEMIKPDGERDDEYIELLQSMTEIMVWSTMWTDIGYFPTVDLVHEHLARVRFYEAINGSCVCWAYTKVDGKTVNTQGWDDFTPEDWVGFSTNVRTLGRGAWLKRIASHDPTTVKNLQTHNSKRREQKDAGLVTNWGDHYATEIAALEAN